MSSADDAEAFLSPVVRQEINDRLSDYYGGYNDVGDRDLACSCRSDRPLAVPTLLLGTVLLLRRRPR